jgi:hypothetical protein
MSLQKRAPDRLGAGVYALAAILALILAVLLGCRRGRE